MKTYKGKYVFTIIKEYVGKSFVKIGKRTIWLSDVLGKIQPIDVGKQVWEISPGVFQVENEEQKENREKQNGRELVDEITKIAKECEYRGTNDPENEI